MNILTSGTFDMLHTGHIKFFEKIKSENSKLTVLIHSNRFVSSYKKNRPIIDENDRLIMIKSLEIVDNCFISDDDYLTIKIIDKYSINIVYQSITSSEKNIWDFYYHVPTNLEIMKYISYDDSNLSTTKIIKKILDISNIKKHDRYTKKEILKSEKFYGTGYQSPNIADIFEKILPDLNPNDNVLEIGSGLGGNLFLIKNKFNCNATGIDISKNMIDICNLRYKNIKFILGDYINYKSDIKYDLILSRDVFMYISSENIYKYILKIKSQLKKGGKLILIDYCYDILDNQFIQYYTEKNWLLTNVKTYKKIFDLCNLTIIKHDNISNKYLNCEYNEKEISIDILKNYNIKKTFLKNNSLIWYYFVLEK